MKKRLFGLLALTLCAMLMSMPMALAGDLDLLYYLDSSGEPVAVLGADLVAGGVGLSVTNEDNLIWTGKACFVTDGKEGSQVDLDNFAVPSHANNGLYQVDKAKAENGVYHLYTKDMGVPFIYQSVRDLQIIGFETEEFDASGAVEATFKDEGVDGPEWNKSYYEIGAYRQVRGGVNAWHPADVDGPTTFTIPLRNVAEAKVVHFDGNSVELLQNTTVTPGGIVVTTDGFSPFAVAWKPGTAGMNPGAGSASQPKTGDSAQLALWFALAGLSLAGMAVIAAKRRKHA